MSGYAQIYQNNLIWSSCSSHGPSRVRCVAKFSFQQWFPLLFPSLHFAFTHALLVAWHQLHSLLSLTLLYQVYTFLLCPQFCSYCQPHMIWGVPGRVHCSFLLTIPLDPTIIWWCMNSLQTNSHLIMIYSFPVELMVLLSCQPPQINNHSIVIYRFSFESKVVHLPITSKLTII